MSELHRFGQQMTHLTLNIAQKYKIIRISKIFQFHPVQQKTTMFGILYTVLGENFRKNLNWNTYIIYTDNVITYTVCINLLFLASQIKIIPKNCKF
jgi:hypothetical protein